MKLSFRWYGDDDKVTLEQIRQIPGMHSIVTAVYMTFRSARYGVMKALQSLKKKPRMRALRLR